MNLSRTKIVLFFVAVIVLAAFVYPREIFLAFMYEGAEDLAGAEHYYIEYLHHNKYNKFATLRLAQLYDRMNEPEKATPLLKDLYVHRKKDWEIATKLLDHLEEMNDANALYIERQEIATDFIKLPHYDVEKIQYLLESALQYALWQQKYNDAYTIIEKLSQMNLNTQDYIEVREKIDRGLKKMTAVLDSLKSRLVKDPRDIQTRREIIDVYIAIKDFDAALKMADESLKVAPHDVFVLQSKIMIESQRGDKASAIRDTKLLIENRGLSDPQRRALLVDLGHLYNDSGDWQNALAIFQGLISVVPDKKAYWLGALSIYVDRKDVDGCIIFLKRYLEKFPDDEERLKLLAETYLYLKKDPAQLDVYHTLLERKPDAVFGLDVANLLIDKNNKAQAELWLMRLNGIFPGQDKIIQALFYLYVDRKAYPLAMQLAEHFLASHSNDTVMTINLAQLKAQADDYNGAAALYDKLANLKSDALTLKFVGKELFFMGLADRAKVYLDRAATLNPDDAENWFWISEVHGYRGEKALLIVNARRVVLGLQNKSALSEDETRMLLKSRARLEFNSQIISDYHSAISKYAMNVDLQSDLIDLLLDKKRIHDAEGELKNFEEKFPQATDRFRPFEVRLAFAHRNWTRAIGLLKEIIGVNSSRWSFRRDLADAYVRAGRWKEGIAEYEAVQKAAGDEFKLTDRLKELHDEYDHAAQANYHFVSLGSEDFMEWGVGLNSYIGLKWQTKTEFKLGDFNASALSYRKLAFYGDELFSYRGIENLNLGFGLGFGASSERTVVSPLLQASYQPQDGLEFGVSGAYRKLRTDLPSAVAQGTLLDTISLHSQWRPITRLIVDGTYEFSRNILPQGQKSIGHRLEPSLSYIVRKKPYITVGYEFSFTNNSDVNGFMSQVALIPRTETHYVTAAFEDWVGRRVFLAAHAFAGEDPARNLHLFQGDLFGVGGKIEWRISDFFNFGLNYDFGRETFASIGGNSHQLGISLTGHWF